MSGTFAVVGLGTMGRNLALNIEEHGFPVVVWNLETDWTDAFLHRIRGDILLKSGPTSTAPAEEAFLIAIAIAQQQKVRSSPGRRRSRRWWARSIVPAGS